MAALFPNPQTKEASVLLSAYDDPMTVAEMALHDIECAAERLRQSPPEIRRQFRDAYADLADEISDIAKEAPRGQH